MPNDSNTLFGSLLDFQWKGISVPTTQIRVRLRQDLAAHKPADRDGAHIEGTGRAPLEFEAHIPLFNTLSPGQSEHWSQPLVPGILSTFFRACADKKTGTLQVPLYGSFQCKFQDGDFAIDANKRAGSEIVARWIETIDDTASTGALTNASAQASAGIIASGLDAQLAQARIIAPSLPQPPATLDSFMHSINGSIDSVTILQKQTAGQIANLVYQVQNLEDHLDIAIPAGVNSPSAALLWPLYNSAEGMKAALYATKKTLLTLTGANVATYTTLADATIGAIFAQIAALSNTADMGDIAKLNPQLFASPVVPKGTAVRYYSV